MYRKITGAFFLVLLACSCKTSDLYFSHPYETITTLPGPEDMVLDTIGAEKQIIIACASRRKNENFVAGIQTYNIVVGSTISDLPIKGLPDSIRFNPHGIDLGIYRGKKILWVINHEDDKKRQSILRFNIEPDRLVYDTLFLSENIISPNDICDGGNGSFYFTNDAGSRNSGLAVLLKMKTGSIVYYNGKGNYQVFNKKFAYPNGIIKFKDQLFFSTSRQNKIFSIQLHADGSMINDSVSLITKGTSWDNFSVNGNHLICTSHSKPIKFLRHRNHEKNESPFQVYSINPITKTKGIVYHTDGESISAGSTAIYYKGDLYICQVFDPYILKVNLHHY